MLRIARCIVSVLLLSGVLAAAPAAAGEPMGAGPFRRVVTGLDAAGRSTVTEDGVVPRPARASREDFPGELVAQAPYLQYVLESDSIWFGALPLASGLVTDPLLGPPLESAGLTPKLPKAGFAAAMMRWAPGGPAFPMHAAPTVDLVTVVSGQVELQLETGAVVLHPGDVVVQRGTKHTWKVLGTEPCVVFVVLLDARPDPQASPSAAATPAAGALIRAAAGVRGPALLTPSQAHRARSRIAGPVAANE